MSSLLAAQNGDHNQLQHILRDPTMREVTDDRRRTPLIIAAQEGHIECVRVGSKNAIADQN